MPKTMIIDMTHFLENGIIPDDIPTPARRLAHHSGAVVMWATRMLSHEVRHDLSNVPCIGTRNRRPCLEYLMVGFEEGAVYWSCDACGSWGRISNWEQTLFDRRLDP
jgi:hypothetical protein